jgi:hypothetical protein
MSYNVMLYNLKDGKFYVGYWRDRMRPINTKNRIETLKKYLSEEGTFIEENCNLEVLTPKEKNEIVEYEQTIHLLKSKDAFCAEIIQEFNKMVLMLIESCPESKEQDEAITLIKKASEVTLGAILRYWNEKYSNAYINKR